MQGLDRVDGFESIAEHTELLAAVGRCFLLPDQDSIMEGVARVALPLLGGVCVVDEMTPAGPARLLEFRRDMRTWIAPAARLAGIARTEICTDNHCPRMTVVVSGSRGPIATLSFASRNEIYGCAEMALAEEIGNRMGLALENVRARTTLNQALTDRDTFISVAAHELRAPACALRICVQTLQRDKAPVSEKQARVLDMIERQERRLSSPGRSAAGPGSCPIRAPGPAPRARRSMRGGSGRRRQPGGRRRSGKNRRCASICRKR